MAKEEGIFTVSEYDYPQEKEILEVEEDCIDIPMDIPQYLEEKDEKEEEKDWMKTNNPEHFIVFLQSEMNRFPKPAEVTGNVSKIEHSLGQWKRLNNYISKALREDYKGILDVAIIDRTRNIIESYIDQLEQMLEFVQDAKRQRKKMRRRRAENEEENITKEATAPHFRGFQMLITPFQRAIAGALINGVVSGGKNMEELWKVAKEKYELNDRDELEIMQIVADMGYPEFKDRLKVGINIDDKTDSEEESDGEWQKQYYA